MCANELMNSLVVKIQSLPIRRCLQCLCTEPILTIIIMTIKICGKGWFAHSYTTLQQHNSCIIHPLQPSGWSLTDRPEDSSGLVLPGLVPPYGCLICLDIIFGEKKRKTWNARSLYCRRSIFTHTIHKSQPWLCHSSYWHYVYSIIDKPGVSKKEHLTCSMVTGYIMFFFSFLQKCCFSKFNTIKAEHGRMS